jgi:hypothetical protein
MQSMTIFSGLLLCFKQILEVRARYNPEEQNYSLNMKTTEIAIIYM